MVTIVDDKKTGQRQSVVLRIYKDQRYTQEQKEARVMGIQDIVYSIKVVKTPNKVKFTINTEWLNNEHIEIEVSSNYSLKDNNIIAAFRPNAWVYVKLFENRVEVPFKMPGKNVYYSQMKIEDDRERLKDVANIISPADNDMAKSLVCVIDLYMNQLLQKSFELRNMGHLMDVGLYRLNRLSSLRTAIINSNKDDSGLSMTEDKLPENTEITLRG